MLCMYLSSNMHFILPPIVFSPIKSWTISILFSRLMAILKIGWLLDLKTFTGPSQSPVEILLFNNI